VFIDLGDGVETVSFWTVSESLEHGPAAIWAFMDPTLDEIQREKPNVDTVRMFLLDLIYETFVTNDVLTM
jgi:hypothetical protein